ncbi:cryptochrome-2-like isoform X3 [Elgaria multicarinata webbii]|uniref:cryptochrome-2-like isoform X3 n=1 Tax=Elgaria multicarinata webbii TaxID=159646 RepID=UPI002FCD3C01
MTHISIHWFRKALRLQDNPALLAAMKDCSEVYPIFILDPWFPKNMRVSVNRWRFLVESLSDLDENLKKLNSRLFVVRGRPAEVFPRLFKKWKVTRLTFEVDTEPYARQRDAEVVTLADEHGVQVIQKVSHTLYDTERIIIENNGRAPLTYTRLQTLLTSLGPPKKPVPAPSLENLKDCNTPVKEDHGMEYGIPSFEELGQDPTKAGPHLYPGGESEALARLDLYMKRTGRTGYPFIDAIMTQLRTEGWIHHLARHAVACFLTRGDLWISWEEGQKVFEELLLDADWSLNAGNWQWLSASAFFHQFFRVYSPVAFGKKTDKNGEYIKKYLPFLQKFPSDYIYEPWKAPRSMQERAGCIIGKDYPKPIVVHEEARKRNLERMKAAYARRSPDVAAQAQDKTSKEGANQKRPMASSKAEVQTKKVKTKRS